MNAFRYHKLPLAALIVGLAALVLWATPSRASEPLFLNYGGFQAVASEVEGEAADRQARFQLTPPAKQFYTHEYWGVPVDAKFAVTFGGTGWMNTESNPVALTVLPQAWGEIDLTEDMSLDIGGIHESNGGEAGNSSSWNRGFARVNYSANSGDWSWASSGMAFWVLDSEHAELADIRTIGEPDSKLGLEGAFELTHASYGSVAAELKGNLAFVSATLDVLDGELQPFVYGLFGKAAVTELPEDDTRAVGVGVTTGW